MTMSGIVALSGLVRSIGDTASLAIMWLVLLIFVLIDIGILGLKLPQPNYMIPASRFENSLMLGILVFSIELGLGIRTRISYAAPYILAVYALLYADIYENMVVVVGWALGRSALMAIYVSRSKWLQYSVSASEHEYRNCSLSHLERAAVRTGNCGRFLTPASVTSILLLVSSELMASSAWLPV